MIGGLTDNFVALDLGFEGGDVARMRECSVMVNMSFEMMTLLDNSPPTRQPLLGECLARFVITASLSFDVVTLSLAMSQLFKILSRRHFSTSKVGSLLLFFDSPLIYLVILLSNFDHCYAGF